jgi:hypothetical protein
MKTRLIVLCLVLANVSSSASRAQNVEALADSAIKLLTWDIEPQPKGTMMFLDVPYVFEDTTDYLSLAVAKNKGEDRPAFISLKLPSTVDKSKGMAVLFVNDTTLANGSRSMNVVKGTTVTQPFDDCDDETCVVRFFNGFSKPDENGKRHDIYYDFLHHDHLGVLFFGKSEHKSLMVPLFTFRDQYRKLK